MPDPQTHISLGAVIIVSDTEVPLFPRTDENGIWELGLPPGMRVSLGTVGHAFDKVMGQFKSDWNVERLKEEMAGMPEAFAGLVEGVLQATMCIDEAMLRKEYKFDPATKKKGEVIATSYRFGFSLNWNADQGELIEGVSIKGIYLTVVKEKGGVTATGATTGAGGVDQQTLPLTETTRIVHPAPVARHSTQEDSSDV